MDTDTDQNHFFENNSNVSWAEDLTYLTHLRNSTQTSIAGTWNLAAGNYTIVFGSDAPTSVNPPRQGYSVNFATAVPEPGSLLLLGALGLRFTRRRR